MPRILVAYVRAISSANERIWKGAVWIVPLTITLLLYETFTRYALHDPRVWPTEFLGHAILGVGIMSGAYLLLVDDHVRIDVFYYGWSPRKKAIFDISTFCLVIYFIILAWTSIQAAVVAIKTHQISPSLWGPPYWPIKTAIATGAILLLLQAIANLIKDIATLRGRPIQ